MIKYRTVDWSRRLEVEAVEVERETEKCVWIQREFCRPCRKLKHPPHGYHYFDTFQDAKDWLVERAKTSLKRANKQIYNLPALYEELTTEAHNSLAAAQKRVSDVKRLTELT